MGLQIEGPNRSGTIKIKGELTVQHACQLREAILKAMGKRRALLVHLEGLTEVDLSGLQVLCSAHRTAAAQERSIAITGKWPEALRRASEESGYTGAGSCRTSERIACLWKSGGIS